MKRADPNRLEANERADAFYIHPVYFRRAGVFFRGKAKADRGAEFADLLFFSRRIGVDSDQQHDYLWGKFADLYVERRYLRKNAGARTVAAAVDQKSVV